MQESFDGYKNPTFVNQQRFSLVLIYKQNGGS